MCWYSGAYKDVGVREEVMSESVPQVGAVVPRYLVSVRAMLSAAPAGYTWLSIRRYNAGINAAPEVQ